MKLHTKLTQKILKFYLLKLSFNEKMNAVCEPSLFSFLNNIKKTLSLILQFHKSGGHIVFIGLTSKTKTFVTAHTQHRVLDSNIDLKEFVSKGFYLEALENNKSIIGIHNSKVKPDLLIVLTHYQKEMLVKECFRLKLPFVSYNLNSGLFDVNIISRASLLKEDVNNNRTFFFETCLMFLIKKVFNTSVAAGKQKVKTRYVK